MNQGRDDARIMIVDDESSVREIISQWLTLQGYSCITADNSSEAISLLENNSIAMVISDIRMPGKSGLWLLQYITKHWPDISVIMLTAVDVTRSAVDCLTQGADNYLVKPINLKELSLSVERALEKRRLLMQNKQYQHDLEIIVEERTDVLKKTLRKLKHSYEMTLEALVASLDAREHETGNHSQRVSMYAIRLAKEFGLKRGVLETISRGGLLHDIGKISIPDDILLKVGKLTKSEWRLMRQHPAAGYRLLKNIDFLESALEIILCHQEWYDGKGYPRGLKGNEIPLGARIFSVVDAFDSMTTDRRYRKKMSFAKAFQEIRDQAGKQFDPDVVEAFLRIPAGEWEKIRRFTLVPYPCLYH